MYWGRKSLVCFLALLMSTGIWRIVKWSSTLNYWVEVDPMDFNEETMKSIYPGPSPILGHISNLPHLHAPKDLLKSNESSDVEFNMALKSIESSSISVDALHDVSSVGPQDEPCISPRVDVDTQIKCASDDSESSWGPVLQYNLATMALEDSKPGEESRSFMFRRDFEVMAAGKCGAGCVEVSFDHHKFAYADIKLCNVLARNVPESRFCSRVIFHAFWGTPPVPPQVSLYIFSFLITQDLDHSQLWVWSRAGVNLGEDPRLSPYVGHPNIEFKQFHGAEILRSLKSNIIPESLLDAKDGQYWLESDLFRVLILHVFGGVYTDMDFLYLRNFGPLLGREWLYQWGSHCVDMNGAVMRLFANSTLGQSLLEHIVNTPPQGGTTAWGRDTYRAVNARMPILRYPACFFNPTWLTGHDIYGGGTHRNSWHGAFGFHLHGPVFNKGPTASADSDYASVMREMCMYCTRWFGGALPRMSETKIQQLNGIECK